MQWPLPAGSWGAGCKGQSRTIAMPSAIRFAKPSTKTAGTDICPPATLAIVEKVLKRGEICVVGGVEGGVSGARKSHAKDKKVRVRTRDSS